MKFMTAATLKNPNSAGSILGRMKAEREQEAAKQETMAASKELISRISSLSPEEKSDQNVVMAAMNEVLSKHQGVNPQALAKLAFDFQGHMAQMQGQKNQQQLFDQSQADRAAAEKNTNDAASFALDVAQSKNPTSLLEAMRNQDSWMKKDGISKSNQSILAGFKQGMGMRPQSPSALDQAKAKKYLAEAEAAKNPKPNHPASYKEYRLAKEEGYQGSFADWKAGGGSKGGEPGSYRYNQDKLKHVSDAVKGDMSGEDPARIKAMAAVEFDAAMQGWKKVYNKKTNTYGYQTPSGKIDIYGNPIQEQAQQPANPVNQAQAAAPVQSSVPNMNLPSVADNKGFQGAMGDMLGKYGVNESGGIRTALKITRGNFNQEDKTITFKPRDENHLKQVLTELNRAGIQFDAAQKGDGTIAVSIIENTPMVKVGA